MRSLVVRAAGGVVVRRGDGGEEILLVHRPKYDDWTLPKGKLLPAETEEAAALREVAEETGLVCRLGEPVGRVRYLDRNGRTKEVSYWRMMVEAGAFAPNPEVDRVRWLPIDQAVELLSYGHDQDLLRGVRDAW